MRSKENRSRTPVLLGFVAACFCLLTCAQFTRPLDSLWASRAPQASNLYQKISRYTLEEVGGAIDLSAGLAAEPVLASAIATFPAAALHRLNATEVPLRLAIWPVHRRLPQPSSDDSH